MAKSKRIIVASAIVMAVASIALVHRAMAKGDDQAEIKALEERFSEGIKAKDVDKVMSVYVPDDTLFVFDVIPPRQYVGAKAYREDWKGAIAGMVGPITFEMLDLSVETDGKLAYGHNVQHFVSTDPKGNKTDMSLRVTDVYRRVNGKWLIAQEHISVPVDLAT